MDVLDVVELCYGEGWRDKNLIAMVAIVGAESQYDESFSDGTRLGLFALRINSSDSQTLLTPNDAARVARNVYEERYFVEWPSYVTGTYLPYVRKAVDKAGEFYISLFERELYRAV